MLRLLSRWLAAALLVAGTVEASALGVFLVPVSATAPAAVGDVIDIEVVLDFSAEPTLGGGFNIRYDSGMLSVVDVVNYNVANYANRDPDWLDGELRSWGLADYSGIAGPVTLGTVAFEVIADGDSLITIDEDRAGIAGAFVSAITFIVWQPDDLDFSSTVRVRTSPVPLPAGLWLMLGALSLTPLLRARAR